MRTIWVDQAPPISEIASKKDLVSRSAMLKKIKKQMLLDGNLASFYLPSVLSGEHADGRATKNSTSMIINFRR
jgi:hypothetical protein